MSATVVAALGNGGGAGSGVGTAEKMEAGLFEQTFVFSAGDEEVVADGTADGELFEGGRVFCEPKRRAISVNSSDEAQLLWPKSLP